MSNAIVIEKCIGDRGKHYAEQYLIAKGLAVASAMYNGLWFIVGSDAIETSDQIIKAVVTCEAFNQSDDKNMTDKTEEFNKAINTYSTLTVLQFSEIGA